MRRIVITSIAVVSLAVYFSVSLFVYPEVYTNKKLVEPKPILHISVSESKINLGESFTVEIKSENIGDDSDILIVSVAFPNLRIIEHDVVNIINYDFTHSPQYIELGEKIGAKYTGGIETVFAEYPSIEAYSRPAPASIKPQMSLEITPENVGKFDVYAKAVGIPHTTEFSHYPVSGILDHQGEFVEVYSVMVIP